jgi:hypothetical protein
MHNWIKHDYLLNRFLDWHSIFVQNNNKNTLLFSMPTILKRYLILCTFHHMALKSFHTIVFCALLLLMVML